MNRWPTKPLGEVAEFINGRAFKPSDWSSKGAPIIRIQNLTDPTASTNRFEGAFDDRQAVRDGDLLVSWSATLDVFVWNRGDAVLNQHIFRAIPDSSQVSKTYLFYALKSVMDELRSKTHGATMKHITKGPFERTLIPVPPLAEQERIVKLLDEADELRKLRARADQRTDDLIPALFHDMFGDTDENSKGLPVVPFGELLAEPLRNGLSPAKDGSYPAKVFTLSAITGEEFDGSAWKEALFARLPDRNCQATEHLFFICRGNGNRELVGRGKFPLHLTKSTVFPDTMIAAAPKLDRLLPAFLEAAWKQPRTRSQIQSNARTTNGTFKINQTAIEQIRLPVPPLPLQKEFAARVSEIRAVQAEQAASRHRLDDLFQSLLHRAFNG